MIQRQSINGVATAASPAMHQKIPSPKICWKSSPLNFLDQDGILLIDYLPKGQTINAEYYSSLLVQLKDILKEKRLHWKVINGVIFLNDKAPAHWALATQK